MSIVTLITDPGIGGTFLSWSLEWLSGKTHYWHFKKNNWLPLCDNPLNKINAHGFAPNQPTTLDQLRLCYRILSDIRDAKDHFVYFHNLRNNDNSYPVDPKINESAVMLTYEQSRKCLLLTLSSQNALYHCNLMDRSLGPKFNSCVLNNSFYEQNQDHINYFFEHDQERWKIDLNLNEIWDHREFLALNLRPFTMESFDKSLFHNRNCMMLAAEDCFFYLDSVIDQIFDYVGISIDKSRWQHWHDIYKRWQPLHRDRMRFCWYFDNIMQAIINNIYLDLACFDLDLYREAAIQHTLLYHHNLNLRTHKLEKFIDTCQLHNLLEPNIYHKLEKYTRS